jgi:hypothetical protein
MELIFEKKSIRINSLLFNVRYTTMSIIGRRGAIGKLSKHDIFAVKHYRVLYRASMRRGKMTGVWGSIMLFQFNPELENAGRARG